MLGWVGSGLGLDWVWIGSGLGWLTHSQLIERGEVFACGGNSYGQLGQGDTTPLVMSMFLFANEVSQLSACAFQ